MVLIMTIVVGGLLLWVLFLGLYHPRSGADVLDWRPTRSPELEAQNEIDDMDQMLEAANERRRARGEAELTEAELESRVLEDRREQHARRQAYLADQADESDAAVKADVEQMLERVNAGRRRRGERELTADEYRAEIESGPGPA
jgi:hypothetical protein